MKTVTPTELVQEARLALSLPIPMTELIDEPFLAAIARRDATALCPCSRATLVTAMREYLHQLESAPDELAERIESAVEGVIANGDLLELHQVAVEDEGVNGTWIFPAPPGFVARRDGAVLVVGMSPDDSAVLSADLSERLVFNRYGRRIGANPGEDLVAKLLALGLIQHAEDTWLRAPPEQKAADLVAAIRSRLEAAPPSGEIPDLTILKPDTNIQYYKRRWAKPKKETGMFVARRPQAHGAHLWGVADLHEGLPIHFIDFPTKAARWRGCDEAWHVQMAVDRSIGTPQRYRVRPSAEGVTLDFYSPIPAWAERRLNVIGHPAPPQQCLLSYWIPAASKLAEEEFLQKRLWLTRDDDKQLWEA